MKIKKGFVVKEIAGQNVVIALGSASKIFNGIIKLNDSARFVWDMLVLGKEKEEVIAAMSEEYEDVDREVLEKDFDAFVETLKGANILE